MNTILTLKKYSHILLDSLSPSSTVRLKAGTKSEGCECALARNAITCTLTN